MATASGQNEGAAAFPRFVLFHEKRAEARLLDALADAEPLPLAEADLAPNGSGVYALYFSGPKRHLYGALSDLDLPIYVGSARAGLRRRLLSHRRSIAQAENRRLGQFRFVCLEVEAKCCTAVEELLIGAFDPLWNREITGFGSKDVGSTRRYQQASLWDTLHPGRERRGNPLGRAREGPRRLRDRVRKHLARTAAGRAGGAGATRRRRRSGDGRRRTGSASRSRRRVPRLVPV